jgi:hypothetical protein
MQKLTLLLTGHMQVLVEGGVLVQLTADPPEMRIDLLTVSSDCYYTTKVTPHATVTKHVKHLK